MISLSTTDTLASRAAEYTNSLEHNDALYEEFTRAIRDVPWLLRHKEHVIAHKLGYGEHAHHYMWYLLLRHLAGVPGRPRLLEIGVYKGQVISLWSLLARQLDAAVEISAITPLKGNPVPSSRWARIWRRLTSPAYRRDRNSGNFYADDPYLTEIKGLFAAFDLDFSAVRLIEGYSNDPAVLRRVEDERFDLVYIDGDHSFEVASHDIRRYGSLVVPGGLLVMDDASCNIPGSVFWKGHETVSRACEAIPALGFTNILNVGHNRVYRRSDR